MRVRKGVSFLVGEGKRDGTCGNGTQREEKWRSFEREREGGWEEEMELSMVGGDHPSQR